MDGINFIRSEKRSQMALLGEDELHHHPASWCRERCAVWRRACRGPRDAAAAAVGWWRRCLCSFVPARVERRRKHNTTAKLFRDRVLKEWMAWRTDYGRHARWRLRNRIYVRLGCVLAHARWPVRRRNIEGGAADLRIEPGSSMSLTGWPAGEKTPYRVGDIVQPSGMLARSVRPKDDWWKEGEISRRHLLLMLMLMRPAWKHHPICCRSRWWKRQFSYTVHARPLAPGDRDEISCEIFGGRFFNMYDRKTSRRVYAKSRGRSRGLTRGRCRSHRRNVAMLCSFYNSSQNTFSWSVITWSYITCLTILQIRASVSVDWIQSLMIIVRPFYQIYKYSL